MGLVGSNATFVRKARRSLHHFLVLVLAVSTLSAISIAVAPPATAAGAGLSLYIKNESGRTQDFTRNEFTTGTCHTLTTSTIDYQWGVGSPGGSCNVDGFTVYATGQILAPVTGTVTFCAIADDGFYLSINSAVVIDNWIDQGANSNCNSTGTYSMVAGQIYSIKTWMHENGGGATMQLLWSYTGQSSYIAVPASNLGTFCSPSSTSSGGYTILTFTSTTTCAWNVPAGVTAVDALVVGGGGAGGGGIGGGGGAGEFVETTRTGLTSGTQISISVGAGGTSNNNWNAGNAGGQSRFDSVIAYGGGGGGTNSSNPPVASGGPNFGSQGGGGYETGALTVSSRSDGITGYRNNGGSGSLGASGSATGGGGGGAGGAGGAGTTSSGSPAQSGGAGGAGRSSSITGTATFYAAGGGGGINGAAETPNGSTGASSGNPGTGGSGIGGSGGAKANAAVTGQYGNRGNGTGGTVNSNGSAGAANTGSGGGGASNWVSGGAGGSGVVIIRYLNAPAITLSTSTISATIGEAVTSYSISNSGGAAASYAISPSLAVSGLSFSTSTGLISGTPSATASSATYTITATNSTSTATATFSISSNAGTPSAPTITGITAGNTTLSVAFTAPSSNGGATISNYEYSTDGGANWRSRDDWPSTASPLVINTLVNGTTYNVQIRAVNSVGNGPATASTSGTPNGCNPSSSTSGGFTVLTFTNTTACQWSVPAGVTSAEVLIVAGGGGGNRGVCSVNYGAGGGGGGVSLGTRSLTPGDLIAVTVGAGGSAALINCNGTRLSDNAAGFTPDSGTNGGSSSFGAFSASGGLAPLRTSLTGGSSGNGLAGGTGSAGYYGAGGGGGAQNAGSGLNGGAGVTSSISGTSKIYGGGGPGRNSTVNGTAGDGLYVAGSTPTANTGGGGSDVTAGAAGVVIVRYINAPSISLSTSTISATVGTAVTSYSISNSGGAAASYAISPSLADSGLNGLTFSTSTGLISGTPSAVATSATFSITATNSSGTSTASFSITTTAGSALTPTFGSTTATADGFTVQISNYSASYTWGGSATASGSVEISGTGLVTVTGVAPGTSSTATIATTRTGYTGGSATVSATSITGSALTPAFGSTTATADGFTVQISNYSSDYTWAGSATASGSVSINGTGLVTVTGVAPGTSSTATITTTRTGYNGGSATVSATSITGAALTPTFGTTTATATGFTVQISNYSASYTWAGTATASGSVAINGTGLITVTGVAPGTSSTATITTTRTGYTGGSATVSETSIIGAALTPTFGIATSTSTGFTVQISNYSTSYTWGGTATASGSVSINGSGLVTVTGVAPGTSSTATITTTRTGYTGGSATVSATSITGSALTPTFGSTTATADGFTVQISNYSASYTWAGSATASGSVAISGTGLVTVTGVAPGTSSTATITTTRTGYTGGSATVSATSLSACSVSSTTASGYTTLRITSVGSCVWTTPSGVTTAEVLVVGGGGGGGGAHDNSTSGGGGAGYVYANSTESISGNILISVGAGGTGGVGVTTGTPQNGNSGGNSTFGSVTALGGAGGFGGYESWTGACPTYTTPVKGGTAATLSQAATGGQDGCFNRNGFGGGGQSSTTNQTGGAGRANSITGTSVTYGTGGTGGTDNADVTPTAQASNTGNGGTGAASRASFGQTGGAGGSGVVIIRYLNAPSITLSSSSITGAVNSAISGYTISNSGGSAASYSISPALSTAGLSFSTSTGLISGTPTATLTSTSYTITATNSTGTSTATFSLTVSISCAAGGVCVVGDTGPGGGIVFYVAPSGGTFACGQSLSSTCKYLEAAPITGASAWTDTRYAWSGNINTAIGTTSTAIGTGYSNTLKMVRQSGAGTAGAGSAARNYRGGGLNDWYLPSKDELNQLYINRTVASASDGYWSSSEYNATGAWDQGFGNGSQGVADPGKQQTTPVRPIRAFGSSAVESAIIYVPAIAGVTAPVSGATPVTTVTAANGYTGTVTWSSSPSTFAAATTYTATITLTAASGFTLTGVTANFFTVSGATSVTHLANSGSITAEFPATAAAAQTITRTSTSPGSPVVAGTYTPTATASSGLTVAITIASGSSSICSISGGVVTFNTAGSCVIQYNQAGNASYAAASQVTETLTIGQGSQSITFGSLSNRTLGSGTYSISATSSSSLTVAFTSATTSVCTVATTTITLVTAGTCTINANQAGNTNYLAAAQVQRSFTIATTLSITTPSGASLQGTYNTAFTSLTISSSGGAGTNSFSATGSLPTGVSLSSAGVISGTPTIAGNFSLTVTVTDANSATATTSSFTISIAKGVSSISISAPAYTFTGSPQGPDSVTTSGSAGAVTYAYAGRGSTTYASSSTKPTNVGTYTVTATLAADSNFASVSATADFAITAGSALNPSFGSTTATADGFTVQISNYSSDYTWGGSATASGSVAISDSGLVTVTGVASGTSATATITTTRTGYTGGSATVSATSISSNVATLSALTLTTATLSPTFASGTTTYTASVVNATTSVTVTPTRTQANATITVNGTAVTSGSASASISLNVGSNTITVVVTAQDGTTTATYTVTVTRAVGAASKVAVTRASVGTQRGTAFTTQPQITVQDSGSNTVTSSSAVVTATVSSGGTLVGTTTATASSGVATFTGLGVNGNIGTTYTITYTVSGLTVATATVTLTGTTCDGSFTCQVGDTGPGGGTIFYVAPSFFTQVGATGSMCTTNCKYLEAAPNTWSGGSEDPTRSWSTNANSNRTTAVMGADGTAIGTGFKNSLDIVAQFGNLAASSAAVAAREYARTVSGTTYTDWYLPSRDELNQMCKWARGQAWISDATVCDGSGTLAAGFTADYYWSSSEVNSTLAWNRIFHVGSETHLNKAAFTYVRPIRAFGPAPTVISVAAIAGVTTPVAGATPVTTTTAGTGYTGTVSWLSSEGVPPSGNFASGTIYAARITLTPTSGYTLTGVNANFFTVTGATSVSNDANSGAITAVFPATAASSVATLSALTLTTATLSPDFAFGTTSYTASVANATTSITVTPTRTQANATITVNGTAVTSGSASGAISLNVGANTITVVVTAQDGTTTATYTVTVTRAEATYTITLAAGTNGSGSNQTLTKTNGTSLTLPDSASANGYFTRAGYTVSGWSTSNGGSQTHALGGSFTTDAATTLYPVWTTVSCSPTSSTAFGYTIYKFTTTGTCFWTVPDGITNVDVLVVAGGGGGGYSWGNTGAGGGGGGQVKTGTATLSSPLEVTVGAGGSAGTLSSGRGGSGGNSIVSSITALGGTGGCGLAAPTCSVASMATASAAANGGAGAASPGNGTRGKGGGGSSTTVSISGSETGGVGTGSDYSGTSVNYGVGGNGGSPTGSSANSVGSSGSVNTGNGGGGASTNSASNGNSALGANGGAGGSGVVIVRKANTLTVTYNANGGTTPSGGSATTVTGGTVSSLATTSRSGYTFTGWFNQASGGTQITTSAGHNYYGNFTLYAQWTANALTVTYDSQGGSAISNGSTTTGGSISASPGTPTRAGYTFGGWSTTDTGTAVTFPHTHGQTANFTLFAKWSANSLTVTYNSQGGSAVTAGGSQTGASISAAPTAPTRVGYTFAGWSTTTTGSVVTFPYAHGQTADFTLYAIWSANSLTVTYDSQSGSAVTSGSVNTGASISAAPTAPTRTGYTFAGWSTTTTGSVVTFPFAHGQTANFTLYAIWSANSLTVNYDSQGGSAVTSGGSQTGASISAAPTAPTRAGYTFGGWSATDTGTAVTFPYAHGQTANFTLFGVWSANSLTVTYNSQGGSAVTAGSVNTGASISAAPTDPTRAGYTFAGWSATDTGTAVTFPYAHGQTANFTLYSIWSANALTITYNSKSGSAVSNGSVNTGASISAAPTAPTRVGYTFGGWSATDTGTAVTFPYAHGQTANFTLFAQWTGNTNTITYNSKGGSAVADGSFVTGGSIAAAPTTPIRAGYTLVGWSLTDGGSVISYPYSPPGTSGITLYAIWTGISCSPTSTTTGGYTIYTFATAGTCFWTVPAGITDVEILTVAGGGGGGYSWDNAGAGGGAGGQVKTGTATLGSILEVTVGAGGTAGIVSSTRGGSGGNSSASTIIALGGTGGCAARATTCSDSAQATSLAAANGGVGGSGGASGKGGGGSNTAGTLTSTTAGGAGTASNYSGTSATYGAGGTGGTARGLATSTNIVGAAGSANTGNGGGGASAKSSSGEVNGGAGGTGLVVVRIASALTITYDSQSGSAISNGSTFTGASIATAPTEPTRSNYTFLGWFTATTGGSAISFPYVHGQTANFTLYARWTLNTYSIVFNANSGLGLMGNQTITHGVATNLNANLYSRANYVFYRWATAADGTGTTYNNLAQVTLTTGTTLYAQWTANTYVVTFNYNGGDGGESTATASFTTAGSPITLPVPTKTGFTFAGWHSDAALTTAIGSGGGSGSYSPTGAVLSLNAYAKWTAINYTFTYNSNSSDSGNVPTESSMQITQTATVKANTGSLVRAGYTFSGWNTASDGTGTNYLSGSLFTVGSANVILYAKWSANTYTVTYNTNGGTGNAQRNSSNVTSDTYTTDSSPVVFPGVGTLTRSGYTFGGWNTSAAGTGTNYVATNAYTTVSNVIFYAKWNPVTYTITYNGNQSDGGTTPTAGGYTTGQDSPYVVLTNSFTKTSSVFGGWNTADNGTGISYSPGASITTLTDIVLYAVWIPQYTLHYAINGGSVTSGSLPGDQLYNTGTSVGPLFSAVSRTGYTFGGWVNGSTTIVPNGNFTILADSVLTAKWTPINYTISYNSDGGSEAPETSTRQNGQSFTVGAAVSKPGYNFTGWTTGNTVVGADAVVVMGSTNIAYTALWVAKVYTISYDWNGGRGTAVADVNYTFGTTAITLPLVGDRVKDGYTFAGWSETSSGSLLSATYIPSRTRTLYAQWTVGNFTITYNLSGGTLASASVAVQNGSSTVLPLPTRTNFVFDGWHTATTGGSSVGSNGTSFTPTASQTVYARWIQASLFGISNSLTRIGSVVTVANIANTFSGANSNSSVSVSVPENALPAGTTINFDLVGNSSRATGLLPNVTYLISIAISWIAGDGTVPDTVTGKPISVTISNETIKIGATAYAIVNNVSTLLGTATQDGTITIVLTSDPEVVIAAVKPSAPLNVAATSNGNQQSVISWSAPSTNGGSAITGYTVTSNTNATCTTSTTSCTISSLAYGTAYTFTVRATNNVGTSDASTAASATTAALYTVTFNAKSGTAVASGSFLTASTVSEPTAPTRTGYSFAGWSATDGGSAVSFPYAPGVTSNITLYARWDALDNAVTFDSKGGSSVSSSIFSSGGTVTEPTAPTRSGFTFAGWSATDTGTAVTFPYAPGVVTDITLYAKWSEIVQNNSGNGGDSSAPAPTPTPAPTVTTQPAPPAPARVTVVGSKEVKIPTIEVTPIAVKPETKPTTIKVDSASKKFVAEVKIVNGKVVLTPEVGFSGKKLVTITITENGLDRTVQIELVVLPEMVIKPTVAPVSATKSTVRWTESPNANSYTIYLEGKKVCSTAGTTCSVNKILGPSASVQIVSNGGDKTLSEKIEAEFKASDSIVVGQIVSPTITKAVLTEVDISRLNKIALIIKSQGFKSVVISEITTTKKTAAMAEARIALIKKYLKDKVGSIALKFEVQAPASRTNLNIISVKA